MARMQELEAAPRRTRAVYGSAVMSHEEARVWWSWLQQATTVQETKHQVSPVNDAVTLTTHLVQPPPQQAIVVPEVEPIDSDPALAFLFFFHCFPLFSHRVHARFDPFSNTLFTF